MEKNISKDLKIALQQREMRIERLLNKFRIAIILSLGILDIFTVLILGGSPHNYTISETIYSTVAVIIIILIEILSRSKKYFPWLKYLSVTYDLTFTFIFAIFGYSYFEENIPGGILTFNMIVSFLYLVLNTFSAFRATRNIILYSGILSVVLNFVQYIYFGLYSVVMFYTSTFLIFSTIFNLWVGRQVIKNFILNFQLSEANNKLKEANAEITQRNEEILQQKEQIEEQKKNIENYATQLTSSIKYARRIQNAVLPDQQILKNFLKNYFLIFLPKSIVSGDFYWLRSYENILYIAVADCTGHGVPGSFVSMLGFTFLNELFLTNPKIEPKELLNNLRQKIKNALKQNEADFIKSSDGLDIALCKIDYSSLTLTFAGANIPVYIIRQNSDIQLFELKPDRQPIGVFIKEKPFTQKIFNLKKGDKIYLFSDGFQDQLDEENKQKFSTKKFKNLLISTSIFTFEKQKNILLETLSDWKGINQQTDDITILAFEI